MLVDKPAPLNDEEIDGMKAVAQWHKEIKLYEKETSTWKQRAKDAIKRYKDERNTRDSGGSKYNILWSTVQTLLPALYARNPKPDVSRRFLDADPVGRVAADVLERSCSYFVNTDLFGQCMRQSVLDYLLSGRGSAWVRYVPHMQDVELQGNAEVRDDGAQISDDMEAGEAVDQQPQQTISYEEVLVDYVHWEDFGHTSGRTWEEVQAVWRKAFLTQAQLKERFPQVYEAKLTIPLDYKQKDSREQPIDNGIQKATIYEIWDKATETVYWVHKDIPKPLDVRPDPLKLKGFFPCPRPLFANLANDSCIPTPDYHQFKDQARQIDQLTGRIQQISKCIKVAGVYDKTAQGIERLLSEGVENQLLGVESWMQFADKGGLKGAMDLLPIKDIADTMMTLHEAREHTKQDLYEITGIADIIRGATDPRETAAAQQMKGQFATLRLGDRQAEIQRYARDTIRLMGEIIANLFQIDTIKKISGVRLFTEQEKQVYGMALQQVQAGQQPVVPLPKDLRPDEMQDVLEKPSWEDVEQLLRDEPARCFRIDIQTDSTIKADKQMERAEKLDFLQNVSGFLSQAAAATESNPNIAPVLAQMLMFGVRAFDVDKDLEQSLNTFITKTQQSQAQPQPDKEQIKLQAQQQGEQAKMQAQAQIEQAKLQSSVQLEQQKAQITAQLEERKMTLQVQAEQAKQQAQAQQETISQQNQMQLEQDKHDQLMQLEQFKIQAETDRALAIEKIKSDTQILVAQISAQQAVTTAQMAAENKADTELANAE